MNKLKKAESLLLFILIQQEFLIPPAIIIRTAVIVRGCAIVASVTVVVIAWSGVVITSLSAGSSGKGIYISDRTPVIIAGIVWGGTVVPLNIGAITSVVTVYIRVILSKSKGGSKNEREGENQLFHDK